VPFRSSAFDLYCRLRQINPSPYLYYFRSDPDQCLLGASPETLVKVQDRHLETWPIAGTRPRGKTPRLDEKNRRNLLGSVKERAEHVMLVDLGRNDLGRVSSIGTVNVKKLMEVKKFSHVMHLVSEVESTLAPSFNAWDALLACFPAGTLTGAPKIRAMQIISELENTARGAYGGAFVVYDFSGDLDSAIIIRSCMVKDGLANFQAGAGIVSDSQAAREFREIEDKAGAVRKALGADVP
jgi:anthranilate synthase component 1